MMGDVNGIGTLSGGTRVIVTAVRVNEALTSAAWVTSIDGDEGAWWFHVRSNDGPEGWVPSDSLVWDE